MWCSLCEENEDKINHLITNKTMIEGCKSFKLESLKYHEESRAHQKSVEVFNNTLKNPQNAPAQKALAKLDQQTEMKMSILFRNTHALLKNNKSFRDYGWLCELDEAKGISIGNTYPYRNPKAAQTFCSYIAESERTLLFDDMNSASFFSLTMDGSTDAAVVEQEIVFARYSKNGRLHSRFIGIASPPKPDADGILTALLETLSRLSMDTTTLGEKLVGFGCDGASVMLGKKGGVATKLKDIQPSLIIVHCLVHRLELAYRDAVKKVALYDTTIVLLMGLYYFYKNSPKQRNGLSISFDALTQTRVIPTRVGGTRWVGHMVLAIETFLKGYQAIYSHLGDVVEQQKSQKEAQNKARGYLRIMKRVDVMAFIHLLVDVLRPLRNLSLWLQNTNITLADVHFKVDVTTEVLAQYITSDGPVLKKFKEAIIDGNTFKGVQFSGTLNEDTFSRTKTSLITKLKEAISSRYADLDSEVVKSTSIGNLERWPKYPDEQDDIKDFGVEEVKTLSEHFNNLLDDEEQETISQWIELRSSLYMRYKNNLQTVKWNSIFDLYQQDFPKIMNLFDLIFTLPATSVENERGFSTMKLAKTDRRTRMNTTTLNDIMSVKMLSPSVNTFNPSNALELWMSRRRMPNFMEEKKHQKQVIQMLEPVVTGVAVPLNEPDIDEYDEDEDDDTDNVENELDEIELQAVYKRVMALLDTVTDLYNQ